MMLKIRQMPYNMRNRRMFRTLSRDNCGESMEPPEEEVMYFGYSADVKNPIVCGSLKRADRQCCDNKKRDYYHWVTFLFVDRFKKGQGFGTQLLRRMETDALNFLSRPFRTESARKAINFFEKNSYSQIGDPLECIAGSDYFRYLYTMEKIVECEQVEDWDEEIEDWDAECSQE